MELKDIRENYRNFEDYQIEQIATEEVNSLRPGVIEILKEEIHRRKLSENLIKGIDAQTREITEKELNEYCTLVRNHTCPKCSSKTQKLNATVVGEVASILVITNYEKRAKIACPDCLDEFNNKGIKKSALLGWWAFPWGPIRTIQSLLFNSKMKKNNHLNEPNSIFKDLILGNIGFLETNRNNPKKLTEFLNKINEEI